MSTSDVWLQIQTQQHASISYYGCFEEQTDGSYAFNQTYSSAHECVHFCLQPGPDDPYFLKFHLSPERQCSCSSRCALVQIGDNLNRVADNLCSTTCPDNSSLSCGGRGNESSYFSVYSIKEDAKSCSAVTIATPMNRPVLIGSFIALVINVLLSGVLLYFTIIEAKETRSPTPVPMWKKISPFNFQLSVMAVSLMGFYAGVIYEAWILGPVTVCLVPLNFFWSASFKTFYLLHSWKRGSAIIFSISSWVANIFRTLIFVAPFVMYAVVIPAIVFAVSLSLSHKQINSLIKESQKWLRIIETISIPIERKFLTICYFGIVANSFCCAAFVAQLVELAAVISTSKLPIQQVRWDAMVQLVFTSVLVTLVAMIVVLRHEDRREAAFRQESLRQALVKYSVTASNETGGVA
ncbi:hypothetical protein BJ741DRAFT_715032 [Chytriomyces cf. hyalinus JEL632]|nr:hypothetical protein BJ741DRAFT_715032 [Chytriomyces cf. hyalinus JEL632]